MEKKKFINMFEGEDKNLMAGVYEDVELSKKINYQVYTGVFLPPQIWGRLIQMKKSLGVDVAAKGLNDGAEKRICMFSPLGEEVYYPEYPMTYFEIEGGNKFKELEHRHFLAAIMGLGIKREKLGDLIVRDGRCYGVITEDLYDFLKNNLTKVGRVEVEVQRSEEAYVPQSEFAEEIVLVSSLRLDSLVAAITGNSRNSILSLIEEGLVTQNYSVVRKKDSQIEPGDTISVRRHGKYIFSEILGESKKGKTRIKLKKYV